MIDAQFWYTEADKWEAKAKAFAEAGDFDNAVRCHVEAAGMACRGADVESGIL